jgi:hypothetical protein
MYTILQKLCRLALLSPIYYNSGLKNIFTMESPLPSELHQIHLGIGYRGYEPVAYYKATEATYSQEHDELQTNLLSKCPAHLWHEGSYRAGCPRPILIGKHHQQQLAELHKALTVAITDIVGRWWTDSESRFPERMPLEREEEDLLQVRYHSFLRSNLAPSLTYTSVVGI